MGFYPDAGRFIYFIAVFFILMLQGESIAVMILGEPNVSNIYFSQQFVVQNPAIRSIK